MTVFNRYKFLKVAYSITVLSKNLSIKVFEKAFENRMNVL